MSDPPRGYRPEGVVTIRLASAEATVLSRIFHRPFRGEGLQSFTMDGAHRMFKEATALKEKARSAPNRQGRELYDYESHLVWRVGHRVYEAFRVREGLVDDDRKEADDAE